MITMIDEKSRFGCRSGAIIYNNDKSKVLLEKQDNVRYLFPGGRIDVHEDSNAAIIRELEEELKLKPDLKLKYILEMFLKTPKKRYHEIGFYYITTINEDEVSNKVKNQDGDGIFEWIPVDKLKDCDIVAKPIKEKIFNGEINNSVLEHIIYREYDQGEY